MERKVLFAILMYYVLISLFYIASVSGGFDVGFYSNFSVNSSDLGDWQGASTVGSFMGYGLNFARFLMFLFVGIGLPTGTPIWIQLIFSTWSIMVNIFVVVLVLNSIWKGGG